jgi:hypothetical protein
MENADKSTKKNDKTQKIQPKMTLKAAKEMLLVDMKDLKLKPREIRFVAAFCLSWDSTKAYQIAGYKWKNENVAKAAGCRLLTRVNISEAIQRYVSKAIEPYKDRLNLMLMEVWFRRAFYDVDMFYNKDGKIKDLDEIPKEWRICIDRVNLHHYGKNGISEVTWSLCSRTEALKEIRAVLEIAVGKTEADKLTGDDKDKIRDIFNRQYKKLGLDENDIIPFQKFRKAE